jgi:hypothetical protein
MLYKTNFQSQLDQMASDYKKYIKTFEKEKQELKYNIDSLEKEMSEYKHKLQKYDFEKLKFVEEIKNNLQSHIFN